MILKDIIARLEQYAPLAFQDGFDNSGLQVGDPSSGVGAALLCLDVTEAIVDEAIANKCELIVSHHPLLFHPLKHVTSATYQERCVVKAIRNGISIYSAHTSLDNAPGGVNYKIAGIIGLSDLDWLEAKPDGGGSGLIGNLPHPVDAEEFIRSLKTAFGVQSIMYSEAAGRSISRVALCGGAGSFLMDKAAAMGADCFVTGEIAYHGFFGREAAGEMVVVALGHYQSEQYTIDLLAQILGDLPLKLTKTSIDTNPIHYE